jgi:N-methylhydantoinase A
MCLDVGGTFTDLYVRTDEGRTESFKSSTVPEDISQGLFDVLQKAAENDSITIEELLENTEQIIHGTTTATNAIIEDETSKTALLTTSGHEESLWLREGDLQNRDNPYDWHVDYKDPYISLSLTYGIKERIDSRGNIVEELDEEEVISVIQELKERNVEAVAVAFLWAQNNPEHEKKVAELIEKHAPDLHYSLGHETNPIIREYRRTVSTSIDASLYNLVQEYLQSFNSELGSNGFQHEPMIVAANGGVMHINEIVKSPIWTVDSGPTMLPVAALEFTQSVLGEDNVIALDMGGTSLDMSVIEEGIISRTRDAKIGQDLLGIEKVNVESIGAGGGSIAWVDEGGLLRIGPDSAGADPGPACYGRGGKKATLTDAAMALGYLSEDYFLGGEMDISKKLARNVIEDKIAAPLGLSIDQAAQSVYSSATQNMVQGIQGVTIERGIDPRKYTISGGGGALGTFVVDVARELQIDDIVLPTEAGVVSSVGGVVSDIRRDFSESHPTTGDHFDIDGVKDVLISLEKQATDFFDRADVTEEDREISFTTEARYPHQIWEIGVDFSYDEIESGEVEKIVQRFHNAHEETYGFKAEDQDVEFLSWKVAASGKGGEIDFTTNAPGETGGSEKITDEPADNRKAIFDGTEVDAPSYHANQLSVGQTISGPAFIDGSNTTIVLPPESELNLTNKSCYHIKP